MLLLHGFPELASSQRHQVPALTAAGYRVIAPDQRSYGRADFDGDLDAFRLLNLGGPSW